MDLLESRAEIDKIDQDIVKLFQRRMSVAKEVAEYKQQTGKKVFDKERENEKLSTLKELADNEFNRHGIEELFTQIMSMSRKLQYGLIPSYQDDLAFMKISQINMENKCVVCYGEKGSYTEQAMEEYFGTDIKYFNTTTFKEVMESIKQGKAHFGVLPIENSSTGGITDIYDLLVEYDTYIIGEHIVKVDQNLLGVPGAKVEDIRTVYSHQQGLLQCAQYLEEHENMTGMVYQSTAASARKVMEEQDITQAAIASKKACQQYGLEILEESINSESNNSTRFIIITNKRYYFSDSNKVSIYFELPHASGTLYNMMSHFIYNNLNMTKIESRPIQGRKWEYRFFVEFEGNLEDPGVKNALNGIKEEAHCCKILGNFHTK